MRTKQDLRTEIPKAFWRFIEEQDKRIIEVVLVFNGVDRFDTIIEPDGLRTDPSTVTIDYNHKRVNTGAYLTNLRTIENYEVEGVNGQKQILKKALVGEIHIPKTAQLYFFDKDGNKRTNGSAYEAVSNGEIRSVSVDFRPVRQSTNTKTGITTYKTWDLLSLSLLDVTPGQPYSGIKILRYLDTTPQKNNSNNVNLTTMSKVEQLLNNKLLKDLSDEQKELIRSLEGGEDEQEPAEDQEPEQNPEDETKRAMDDMRGVLTKIEKRMGDYNKRLEAVERVCGMGKDKTKRTEEDELKDLERTIKERSGIDLQRSQETPEKDIDTDQIVTQARALGTDEEVQYKSQPILTDEQRLEFERARNSKNF